MTSPPPPTPNQTVLEPTRGLKYWAGRAGCRPDAWATLVSDARTGTVPRPTTDTLMLAADPIAEALIGDLPNVAVPSPEELLGADDRSRWAWSGNSFNWLPGVDGRPGATPRRVVHLRDAGVPLGINTVGCPPVMLDHQGPPVFRHISGLPGMSGPAGYDTCVITGGSGTAPGSWRDAVRAVGRGSDAVAVDPDHFRSGLEAAFVTACMSALGIPTWVQRWSPELTMCLHPDLVAELMSCDSARLRTDAYYRDQVGVRLRRHVLEHHSERQVWGRLESQHGSVAMPSVLIMVSSIRPHFLQQVVQYLNLQTYQNLEVRIVVDRVELPSDVEAWCLDAADFDLSIERNDELLTVGEIYNNIMRTSDADIAIKWDDDDHYAPEHVQDLVQALLFSHATIAGKWAEFFHLAGPDITIQRSPEHRYRETSSIGGSSMAMWRSAVLAYGGFRPTWREDQELIERVRSRGGRTYRTHGYGYVAARRSSGHLWSVADGYFLEQSVRQWPGLALDAAGFGRPSDVISGKRYR